MIEDYNAMEDIGYQLGRAARKGRENIVKDLKKKMSKKQWAEMNKCSPIFINGKKVNQ